MKMRGWRLPNYLAGVGTNGAFSRDLLSFLLSPASLLSFGRSFGGKEPFLTIRRGGMAQKPL